METAPKKSYNIKFDKKCSWMADTWAFTPPLSRWTAKGRVENDTDGGDFIIERNVFREEEGVSYIVSVGSHCHRVIILRQP